MANTKIYWLHTLSPTHVGTGRGLGYIDLPIHRDKVTNWPVIPGSAFKGVWADAFRATEANRKSDVDLGLAFGRASDDGSNSGALIPTDARLVCLPVRSFQGTFAWCTSPLALQMLHRDLTLAGEINLPELPPSVPNMDIHLSHNPPSLLKDQPSGRVFLEDLDFNAKPCQIVSDWATKLAGWVFPGDDQVAWRSRFIERFAVVPDTIFDFLTETGTEVTSRVKIDDDSKTVANGQLWNEESLPAETILFGLVTCDRIFRKKEDRVTGGSDAEVQQRLVQQFATKSLTLQIGGKATVGRGRVRCAFTPIGG
jgi:CRISPR-associated protein Cmr4